MLAQCTLCKTVSNIYLTTRVNVARVFLLVDSYDQLAMLNLVGNFCLRLTKLCTTDILVDVRCNLNYIERHFRRAELLTPRVDKYLQRVLVTARRVCHVGTTLIPDSTGNGSKADRVDVCVV